MNKEIFDYLDRLYPDPKCELNYNKDYELLIAVMLSAQTTDKRVNKVTEVLFNKFKSIIHHPNNNISDKMKQALKLYRNNEKYIENSFKYDINNGRIEGTNNYIKCIKRIAFGYRKFSHFKARILLNKGIIKG